MNCSQTHSFCLSLFIYLSLYIISNGVYWFANRIYHISKSFKALKTLKYFSIKNKVQIFLKTAAYRVSLSPPRCEYLLWCVLKFAIGQLSGSNQNFLRAAKQRVVRSLIEPIAVFVSNADYKFSPPAPTAPTAPL